jgi:hypothetical protein
MLLKVVNLADFLIVLQYIGTINPKPDFFSWTMVHSSVYIKMIMIYLL